MFSTSLLAICAAAVVATAAAILQTRLQRVPNTLTLGSLGLAWLAALAITLFGVGPGGLPSSLAAALAGGLSLLPFYLVGSLGAGCIKAQMSFGAWIGCAMGLSAAVTTALVATLVGRVLTFGLYALVVRLYPAVEYDVTTWTMNAQSPLSVGSIAGLIGCLWYGVA